MTDFTLQFLEKVYQPGKNLVFSPTSIRFCFGLAALGTEGSTRVQICNVLGLPLDDKEILRVLLAGNDSAKGLNVANAIYVDSKRATLQDLYRMTVGRAATIENIDFAEADNAAYVINKMVREATQGMIASIVDAAAVQNAVMVLVNAIHFAREWAEKLTLIGDKEFKLDDGNTVKVPFISTGVKERKVLYAKMAGYQVVSLPYEGGNFNGVLVIPDDNVSVAKMVDSLTESGLQEAWSALRMQDVKLSFPKFKIKWEYELSILLKALGITNAFVPALADFRYMCDQLLFASQVLHKAVIEVDEDGTRAAAVTAVVMRSLSISIPIVIDVDRPFLFAVVGKDGEIHFLTAVENPQ